MHTIFITGAGQGIGRASAKRFAQQGWRVAATDINASALESLKSDIGGDHFFKRLDVKNSTAVQTVMAEFADQGRFDVLLNNAGILFDGPFEDTPLESLENVIAINVTGMQNCAYAAFPFLKAAGGRMINMGSASATFGIPGLATYSASKFFVRGFTEALSIEWRKHGIRVSEITPGIVRTAMTEDRQTDIFKSSKRKLNTEHVVDQIFKAATCDSSRLRWPVDGLIDRFNRRALAVLPVRMQQFFVAKVFATK